MSQGDRWKAEGPDGTVLIRFTGHNPFGVMDHWAELPDGTEIHVPLRVIANGEGAQALLTLFRQPGMTDERFGADADWVARDLAALKTMTEG